MVKAGDELPFKFFKGEEFRNHVYFCSWVANLEKVVFQHKNSRKDHMYLENNL